MSAPPRRRRDVPLLFATRAVRLFAYGLLSVVLVLHLSAAGLDEVRVGLLLSLTLLGDTALSLWITTRADRLGRRRMLVLGALLMVAAAVVFTATTWFPLLLLAATVGVMSPSGNEVGPFLAIEQAALAHELPGERRTATFAWYQLAGAVATALGALAGGALAEGLQRSGVAPLDSYRAVIAGYGALGLALAALFLRLSPAVEVAAPPDAPGRPARPAPLAAGGARALGALLGGRLRGRLRGAELRGLVVPPPVRRQPRHARAPSSSAPTCWPGSRRSRPPPSPGASAW